MACAKDGHADVAALLLDGVSTDFVGDATADGYTALLAACNYGHVEVARLLWTTAPTSMAASATAGAR